jgi:chromosome segregation ATPase
MKKKIREHEEKADGFETEENGLRLEITAIKKRAAERKNKFRAIIAEIEKLERAVRKCQEAADAINPEKKTELEHQLSEIGKEKRSLRSKVESMNRNGRALQDEGNSIQQQLVSTQRQYVHISNNLLILDSQL